MGKTTLLDALVERACGQAVVLRACGAETEVELAFSALADLLHPLLGDLGALPPLQAAALTGALALGPPLPGDRLAVCVATLGVLRAAAARRPVLVVLDDVQWVDASSRECVEYVARRSSGSLSVVLAARDPWYESATVRLPELALAPLDDAGAAEVLQRRAPGLAPPVAAAIADVAAGNPLALVELPATLTAEQRTGVAALDLPLAPGGRLQHAFAGRVGVLTGPAQRALLIAAVDADGELSVIADACRRAGTDVACLAEAEACGLVHLSAERVTFVHPLARGTVYQDASAAGRRAAHAAIAAVVHDDRRVWHLAAAAIGPNERVATKLERLGRPGCGAQSVRLRLGRFRAGRAPHWSLGGSKQQAARGRRCRERFRCAGPCARAAGGGGARAGRRGAARARRAPARPDAGLARQTHRRDPPAGRASRFGSPARPDTGGLDAGGCRQRRDDDEPIPRRGAARPARRRVAPRRRRHECARTGADGVRVGADPARTRAGGPSSAGRGVAPG